MERHKKATRALNENLGLPAEYPTPKLICPATVIAELPPFSNVAEVRIPRPKTDLNMKRDVTIKPSWLKARKERVALEKGELNVTFTAKHPISRLTASCSTAIYVVGKLSVCHFPSEQLIPITNFRCSVLDRRRTAFR